jgi:hypothetical protein
LEIKKGVLKLTIAEFWAIIKIIEKLMFKLNDIELEIHGSSDFDKLYGIFCHIHQNHVLILSGFKVLYYLGLDEFTKLIDYFVSVPNLKLKKFYTNDVIRSQSDAQYLRLLQKQNCITNITSQSFRPKAELLEHVVKRMPHVEELDLWINTADLKYLLIHLNLFKKLQHLSLDCEPPNQPLVLDFLKDLKYLESVTIKTDTKCELKLTMFERAFKNMKKQII